MKYSFFIFLIICKCQQHSYLMDHGRTGGGPDGPGPGPGESPSSRTPTRIPTSRTLGCGPIWRGSSRRKSSCDEIFRVGCNPHDYVSGLRATLLADRPSPSPIICCPHSVWTFSVISLLLVAEPQALPEPGAQLLLPPPPALPGLCDECCLHGPLPP